MKNAWRTVNDNNDTDLKDALDDLFIKTPELNIDDASDELEESPVLLINLDDVNTEASNRASIITERLSNYYFDEKYIKSHPYIPNKISQEMDSMRRLIKMLTINEKAQDALIMNITCNGGKGALYQSLTSLQNATLSIQNQLEQRTQSIENIFKEMQAECDKTWQEKDKEEAEDGSMTVRGSKEFIKQLNEKLNNIGSKINISEIPIEEDENNNLEKNINNL